MHIFILRVEWRILYLIYTNKVISYNDLAKNFDNEEFKFMNIYLNNFTTSNIIDDNEIGYSIKNTELHPFLKIFHYIATLEIPETRSEIRNKVKHKILRECLEELTQSGILYEYRTEISRKIYILVFDKKDSAIEKIETQMKNLLNSSEKNYDKAHLIMINNKFSITSSNTEIDLKDFKGKYEKKIISLLSTDVDNKHKFGFTFEEIIKGVACNPKITESNLMILVDKGIVKNSRRNVYYINNFLLKLIKKSM